MTQEEIFSAICELFSKKLDLPKEELSLEKNLRADLALDSMTLLELIMEIEVELNIQLDQREADQWKTISDLVKAISARQAQ